MQLAALRTPPERATDLHLRVAWLCGVVLLLETCLIEQPMDVEELHKDVVRLGNRNGLRIFATAVANILGRAQL
jgi:hypothetical protein